MTATTKAGPDRALLDWLRQADVEHEIHAHDEAFSALGTARAEGVSARTFAKVVGVRTGDGADVLLVVDATDRVDLAKARSALDAADVRLLTEGELRELAPDCEAGAIPAVGALFELPMYADHAVREDRDISFNAGSHRFSVRVDRAAWERASGVHYADLAVRDELRPAWEA